jgi:hypothetical protein
LQEEWQATTELAERGCSGGEPVLIASQSLQFSRRMGFTFCVDCEYGPSRADLRKRAPQSVACRAAASDSRQLIAKAADRSRQRRLTYIQLTLKVRAACHAAGQNEADSILELIHSAY